MGSSIVMGVPNNIWLISWKTPSGNGWWLGAPLWLRKPFHLMISSSTSWLISCPRISPSQAETLYGLVAANPVFFKWSDDPEAEVRADFEAGRRKLEVLRFWGEKLWWKLFVCFSHYKAWNPSKCPRLVGPWCSSPQLSYTSMDISNQDWQNWMGKFTEHPSWFLMIKTTMVSGADSPTKPIHWYDQISMKSIPRYP